MATFHTKIYPEKSKAFKYVIKEVKNAQGEVTDITLDYTEGYIEQMLWYSKEYSFLPTYN